jgi:DNA-binding transcriptional ArsR family regulator
MEEIEELAEIFKALSDPTRLKLVKLLSECSAGECSGGALCVNALAHRLGVTQSAVSQHLRVLRQAGLVNGQRRGYHVHYSLDRDRLAQYRARVQETLGEDFVVIK